MKLGRGGRKLLRTPRQNATAQPSRRSLRIVPHHDRGAVLSLDYGQAHARRNVGDQATAIATPNLTRFVAGGSAFGHRQTIAAEVTTWRAAKLRRPRLLRPDQAVR